MNINAAAAVFADLQKIVFDGDKVDEWENQTDILEVAAVAAGEKPAHLSGAGTRGLTVLPHLEAVATAHGLHTLLTSPIRAWRSHPSTLDPKLDAWLSEQEEQSTSQQDQILWIYSDAETLQAIEAAVVGDESVSRALGYPTCCTQHSAESHLAMHEGLYSAYWEMAGGALDKVSELVENDVQVSLDEPIDMISFDETLPRYPFLQFTCCRGCLNDSDSPAAAVNRRLANLARSLSPAFERRIRDLAAGLA